MTRKIKEPQPSRFSKWLIKRIFKDEGEVKLGDFMEIYSTLAEEKGRHQARLRFWGYLIRSIPEYFKDSLCMGGTMFKSHLKIALRSIKRDKWHTLLNISGLTVGMACFILILLYVQWELSYDKFHENADRIYRVIHQRPGSSYMGRDAQALIPAPAAQALVQEYPEIIKATGIRSYSLQDILFTYKDKNFYGADGLWADKNFFDIFSFHLAKGDPKSALADPFSIVLTERIAKKYFGNEDPYGKILTLQRGSNNYNAKITGIIKELPKNSHIQFDFLISHISWRVLRGEEHLKDWNNFTDCTYIELHKDADYRELEKKFSAFIDKYMGYARNANLLLQPSESIHLKSDVNFEISVNNNMGNIYIFSVTAFIILIIACINYMNLATARASRRTKEVGIRKVIGALRNQLIKQFIGESLILIIIAFLLGSAIATVVLPSFNSFIDREINLSVIEIIKFLPWLITIIIISVIVSGLYPALFISSFQPVRVLKGVHHSFSKKSGMRNILVIVQFGISMILIIGTIIIVKQLNYIRKKDVGFNREQILVVRIRDEKIQNNFPSIKNTLLQHHEILGTSLSWHLPSNIRMMSVAIVQNGPAGEEARLSLYRSNIDQEFLNVFEIELLSGRNFSENFANEAQESVLINETAARHLGWKNPLGKKLIISTATNGKVIGVMKDFHFHSFYSPIEPLALLYTKDGGILSIKVRGGDIKHTIDFVKETFEAYDSKYPFEYFFFDDSFNEMYRAEQKLGSLFSFFSALAIFIACLGLLGLASFKAEVYTKEIGIRKVLGASVSSIVVQLSKEFIKWIIIANAVALPVSYFAMNKWLQNFAYRTNISIWTFIQSIGIALIAALVSVSYQSVKAATANPVDCLRYE